MAPPPQLGQWTTGFCDCCSHCDSCCCTFWCPCIAVGRIVNVADLGQSSCFEGCCIWTALQCTVGLGCLYSCTYRKKVRVMFNLPAAPCNDFVADCCCPLCSISQTYREQKNRGLDPALGYRGNAPAIAPAGQFMQK
ncbi:hypothetical protein KP509_07G075100 [Ceratopteris richardii]|uniref:Uncharacterized protein n=1 Tax=Ceratopteris richardii TaxID=49495 RepID=A0A8T2UDN7_CERRI|nr:hypothetical protein KP509_07G075100 [Ceratopteris richardii]